MLSKKERLYLVLASFYVAIAFMANLITVKLVALPLISSMAIPSGLLLFPFTFLIADLVTEIFGSRQASFMVYLGFTICIICQVILMVAIKLPVHPSGYSDPEAFQKAFSSIFGLNGMALLSSLFAYGISQILDIRLFAFFRKLTKGKHLWLRNGASTWISQIIDTLVVNILFLYYGMKLELPLVLQISLYSYFFKAFFTLVNIPVFYLCVRASKQFIKPATQTLYEQVFDRK